jgi:hypothetical protein
MGRTWHRQRVLADRTVTLVESLGFGPEVNGRPPGLSLYSIVGRPLPSPLWTGGDDDVRKVRPHGAGSWD